MRIHFTIFLKPNDNRFAIFYLTSLYYEVLKSGHGKKTKCIIGGCPTPKWEFEVKWVFWGYYIKSYGLAQFKSSAKYQ